MVLNEWQLPEWQEVKWSEPDGKVLILHSFCVQPAAQGSGYGGKMLEFVEASAKEKGYAGIRLDAFSGNPGALKFYESRGYIKKGEIFISTKPLGHCVVVPNSVTAHLEFTSYCLRLSSMGDIRLKHVLNLIKQKEVEQGDTLEPISN